MLNNFIGGGQVFLHKVRMFRQVLRATIVVSAIAGMLMAWSLHNSKNSNLDLDGAYTYFKAQVSIRVHPALSAIAIKPSPPNVDAYSNGRLVKRNMLSSSVVSCQRYVSAWNTLTAEAGKLAIKSLGFGSIAGFIVFMVLSRFGKGLKTEKKKDGSGEVLTPEQVQKKLKSLCKVSSFKIGNMPLVKDMETRHFLVTGQTGSGKTNLIHNILPQVVERQHPAIIIDQTGEMIARYYDVSRGDIIFNPMDARGKAWNFFEDCSNTEELERFSKILFSFNRKSSMTRSDPFWEQSAEVIFNECVKYLTKHDIKTIESLKNLTINATLEELKDKLIDTPAARYLTDDSKGMSSSVLSTLATSTRPISYLSDGAISGKFSLKRYFRDLKEGSNAWLFLSTKPSNRDITLPLIACLAELCFTQIMDIGINKERKIWTVLDELARLGNLPALSPIMSEGRKYGVCVIAALQSLNQLYDSYGQYAGSSIFGQFGTTFFFRNTETSIGKLFSSMSGTETITRQQKNTSFGANEFRDGVSYNEHQQRKELVEYSELSNLQTGECYTFLPEPKVKLSKMQVPEDRGKDKNQNFIQLI